MMSDRKQIKLGNKDGLIVVDLQKCFLPGGRLGVPSGDRVIEPLNRTIEKFRQHLLPIIFSRDWHPPDHISFRHRGGPWPPHCIRDTEEAAFPAELHVPEKATIVSKGTHPHAEEYSAFGGRNGGRSLKEILSSVGVERVFIGGLATDYCVLNTALDAVAEGLEVFVLADATRAVDAVPGDREKALREMEEAGVVMIETEDIEAQ